ncbi:hypothetical protein D3C71_1586580 [compost metagenome]
MPVDDDLVFFLGLWLTLGSNMIAHERVDEISDGRRRSLVRSRRRWVRAQCDPSQGPHSDFSRIFRRHRRRRSNFQSLLCDTSAAGAWTIFKHPRACTSRHHFETEAFHRLIEIYCGLSAWLNCGNGLSRQFDCRQAFPHPIESPPSRHQRVKRLETP